MSNQKVVVLNAAKMNYDGLLDFSILSPETIVYEDSSAEEIIDRIQGACVVVTKELPVPAEMIEQFPDSVRLICEAGTGYNNIAIDAAVKKGITVCNVPAYSSHRVAHTAIMMMLNLSSKNAGRCRIRKYRTPGDPRCTGAGYEGPVLYQDCKTR